MAERRIQNGPALAKRDAHHLREARRRRRDVHHLREARRLLVAARKQLEKGKADEQLIADTNKMVESVDRAISKRA
jgi:hypothetical protein